MTLERYRDDGPPTFLQTPKTAIRAPDPQTGTAGELRTAAEGGGVFYVSERRRDKHFFRKYQGYGISKNILQRIWEQGIRRCLIVEPPRDDHPEGRTYQYRLATFADGEHRHTVDNEGDVQYIVPVEYAERTWDQLPHAVDY